MKGGLVLVVSDSVWLVVTTVAGALQLWKKILLQLVIV
jgi:hypothetical protein